MKLGGMGADLPLGSSIGKVFSSILKIPKFPIDVIPP
jgi:hypothetical protein